MFELLKIIIERLAEALSPEKLGARRRQLLAEKKVDALTDIGTELFLLFLSLNRLFIQGNQIGDHLEDIIHSADTGYSTHNHDLQRIMRSQLETILQLHFSLNRLEAEIQAIDPKGYRKLVPLLYEKCNALQWLYGHLELSKNNLGLTSVPEKDLLSMLAARKVNDDGKPDTFGDLLSKLREGHVDIPMETNKGNVHYIRTYLKHRNPRNQLVKIEQSVNSLREAIEKNFSISEILLKVHDQRLKAPTGDWYEWRRYSAPPTSGKHAR